MLIDTRDWLQAKPGKFVRPVFTRILPDGRYGHYFVKQPQGYPMDIKVSNDHTVDMRYTDFPKAVGGTGAADSYRFYQTPIPIFLRFYDLQNYFANPSTFGRVPVAPRFTPSTLRFTSCGNSTPGKLGPVETYMRFEPAYDFGGDIGIKPRIVGEFWYTLGKDAQTFVTCEEFSLTEESAWLQWDLLARNASGSMQLSVRTQFNKYIPDTLQVPVVPCDVVL